jgi:uncharacterized protein YdaU (DUF1376 family)
MFSYHHHIGDFRRDTASLSDTDAMAYLKLLWMYYDTEQPLPANPQLLAFKIGSNAESVQLILDAFFTLDGDVYRQKRCEAEIAAYYGRKTVARDNANKRWKNANASQNDAIALPLHSDSNAIATKIDANREPITENQKSITPKRPEDVSDSIWKDWLRHRKGLRASVTETVINRIRKEADKASMPLESVFELMCARGWRGFEAEWVKKSVTNDATMGRRVL